jgi:hypothetical protein
MEFDSSVNPKAKAKAGASPLADGLEKGLRPLVGVPVELTVNSAGTVISTTGAESLLTGKAPHVRFANQFLDAISVNRKFGTIFSCLGSQESAAQIGQVLEKDESIAPLPELPPLKLTRKLNLIGLIEKRAARFELSGTGAMQPDPAFEKAGMKVERVDVRLTGSGVWDTQAGLAGGYHEVQDLDIRLSISELPVRVEAKLTLMLQRAE